ncbi:hypothetical protein ABIA85_009791 [Bradyrhizobium sp. LA6.10]|uniref:hypothetical protein n=1 Tax=Bradyrhizobium sp. LA6.10 TaxID=3156318 RepID=UPI00339680D4
MPKYKVVTPKGASFTVAGSDYSYEREALDPIDAESVEAPANEAEFIAAARTADAIYARAFRSPRPSSMRSRVARSSRSARSVSTAST